MALIIKECPTKFSEYSPLKSEVCSSWTCNLPKDVRIDNTQDQFDQIFMQYTDERNRIRNMCVLHVAKHTAEEGFGWNSDGFTALSKKKDVDMNIFVVHIRTLNVVG